MDIAAMKQAAHAATPGPWELLPVIDRSINHLCPVDSEKFSLLTVVHQDDTPFGAIYKDDDARFIAAANPAAVLELIAALGQLATALKDSRVYVASAYECAFPDEQKNESVLKGIDSALAAAGAA